MLFFKFFSLILLLSVCLWLSCLSLWFWFEQAKCNIHYLTSLSFSLFVFSFLRECPPPTHTHTHSHTHTQKFWKQCPTSKMWTKKQIENRVKTGKRARKWIKRGENWPYLFPLILSHTLHSNTHLLAIHFLFRAESRGTTTLTVLRLKESFSYIRSLAIYLSLGWEEGYNHLDGTAVVRAFILHKLIR